MRLATKSTYLISSHGLTGFIPKFRKTLLPASSGGDEGGYSKILRNIGVLPHHCTHLNLNGKELRSFYGK
jgi:hypothetical protein